MNLLRTSLTITLGALLLSVAPLTAGKVPRPAPSLEAKTLDGKTVSLNGLKGKVVAVLFFSTDCPHCQNTTRILNPIYDEWKARGLEIMGMAVNPQRHPVTAHQFLKVTHEGRGQRVPGKLR